MSRVALSRPPDGWGWSSTAAGGKLAPADLAACAAEREAVRRAAVLCHLMGFARSCRQVGCARVDHSREVASAGDPPNHPHNGRHQQ